MNEKLTTQLQPVSVCVCEQKLQGNYIVGFDKEYAKKKIKIYIKIFITKSFMKRNKSMAKINWKQKKKGMGIHMTFEN